MSNRKYENYKIIVTYDNGDKEEINYKGINTSSYKDMLNLYNEVKEKYSDRCVVIDFVGVGENGNLSVFWTKKIENRTEEETNKNEEDNIDSKTSIELLSIIGESLEILKKRKSQCNARLGAIDKEQDIQLHKIESIRYNKFETEEQIIAEKLKIFDALEEIRIKRRYIKNEGQLLQSFVIPSKLESIECRINSSIQKYDKLLKKDDKTYLSSEKLSDLEVIKKVSYTTEKERLHFMKQLTPKYKKVTYADGVITCYNRGYSKAQ